MNTTIQQQIEINERAYLLASKSKESAIRFLEDAGIIKKHQPAISPKQSKKSSSKVSTGCNMPITNAKTAGATSSIW